MSGYVDTARRELKTFVTKMWFVVTKKNTWFRTK